MSKAGFQCFTPVTGTVNVGNWDQMPNLGIELGGVEVGCITDPATGAITGKVFLVIEKSEDGVTTTSVLKAVDYATGSVIDPYVGPIDACVPPAAPQLQAVNLEEMCLRVDGAAQRVVPVAVFDQAAGTFGAPVYLDEMGNAITGVITAADPCECSCTAPCDESEMLTACGLISGFDAADSSFLLPGQTQEFSIVLDGAVVNTLLLDYTTTSDGVNKSSWYTPLISAVNAIAGWTMTVDQDVAVDNSTVNTLNNRQVPVFRLEYAGTAPSSLNIINEFGQRESEVAVDAAGAITVRVDVGGMGMGSGTPNAFPCA